MLRANSLAKTMGIAARYFLILLLFLLNVYVNSSITLVLCKAG